MATESWAIDGVSLTSGNFVLLELTADPPKERQDWVSAADSESAALFRQPKHENRTITMKIRVTPQASMNAALDQVGAVVDKLRKASGTTTGVPLVWTPGNSSRSATFTVLTGEITGLPISMDGDGYSWILQRPILNLELTCQPYGYGTETLTSVTTSAIPFAVMDVVATGDAPALGRLIVTDNAFQSRRHVEWGLEGPLTYNNATSLLVDSDDMVTTGFSGTGAVTTGAYDPNSAGNNSISLTLVASTTTALCGTGNLSHVGVFRVKARVQSGALANQFRLAWKSGDGPLNRNAWVSTTNTAGWIELDLGTITVPATISGTQRWTGQIEVLATATSPGTAVIDYLILVPQADGYGLARAVYSYSAGIATGYDAFVGTTAAAALATRAAPLGGSWATSGDATDFAFQDNFNATAADGIESISRATTAAETNGRFAILGSTAYTDTQVDVRARIGSATFNTEQSLIARWVDSSNYLRLSVPTGGAGVDTVKLETVVAGAVVTLASANFNNVYRTNYRFRLIAFSTGRALGYVLADDGTTVLVSLDASSSALATSGALVNGKAGLRDRPTGATVGSRYFTAFSVSTPPTEPIAIYSSRTIQFRYDDTIRDDSTATYTGRPQSYRGSRCLIPPGTSRVFAKARRNDVVTALDDQVTDSTKIQVGWTPRYLAVPR
jgi:hypothetical protein